MQAKQRLENLVTQKKRLMGHPRNIRSPLRPRLPWKLRKDRLSRKTRKTTKRTTTFFSHISLNSPRQNSELHVNLFPQKHGRREHGNDGL